MTNEKSTMKCLDILERVSEDQGLDKVKASEYIIEAMQLNSANAVLVEKASGILGKYVSKTDFSAQLAESQSSLATLASGKSSERKNCSCCESCIFHCYNVCGC